MITLNSAENVLKEVYLGIIADQINAKTNPLFGRIKKSSRNIVGKEVRVVAPIGIDGGILAGDETSNLPNGAERPYLSFVAPLKNLYGRFEISDKAIRSSANDAGAFVNLLQDGMESLLKASMFNLSRMIYGDGTGLVSAMTMTGGKIYFDRPGSVLPGMILEMYDSDDEQVSENNKVASVDLTTGEVKFTIANTYVSNVASANVYVQGSKNKEIVGLRGIVDNTTLYGVAKANYPVMNAQQHTGTSSTAFDEDYVQSVIDELEVGGTIVNFINCSYELKRLYQRYLTLYKKNIAYTTLEDGMKVLTHCGIPIVPTTHLKAGEAFFLNTDDFTFYQLGDWRWLENENGRILHQHATKPTYAATLVKYTELVCQKPNGVGYCKNIPTTVISGS